MTRPVVIWGASGHALVLMDMFDRLGYHAAAFVDNDPARASPIDGVPVLHGEAGLDDWLAGVDPAEQSYLVAIGGPAAGRARRQIGALLRTKGLAPAPACHPDASIARTAKLGSGVQVLANAAVTAHASIGDQCILNTGASVDHECEIAAGVHVAPGAVLTGLVRVGMDSFIGAGSVVLPRLTIGSNTIVGAGSVVTRDLPDNAVAYGNPARVHRTNSPTGPSNPGGG